MNVDCLYRLRELLTTFELLQIQHRQSIRGMVSTEQRHLQLTNFNVKTGVTE